MAQRSEQQSVRARRASAVQLVPFVPPVVALVLACGVVAFADQGRADRAPPAQRKTVARGAAPDARPLATFEGGQVTVADLQVAIANKAPSVQRDYETVEGRAKLLHALVDYSLLIAEATRRGYVDHLAVRDQVVRELGNRVTTEVGASVDDAALPEAELRAYYDAHRARFAVPPLRRASFVRVPTQQEADALYQRARAMPLDQFRTLAVQLDTSGKGSEIGYVDAEGRPSGNARAPRLDPVLVAQSFALEKVGEVAKPFAHQAGFVVLRLSARQEGSGSTFESVEQKVREQVGLDHREQALDALVERLRKEQLQTFRPELADGIALDPVPPPDVPAGVRFAPPDPRAPTVMAEPDDA